MIRSLFTILIIINIFNDISKKVSCFSKYNLNPNDISICMVGDLLIHQPILNYAESHKKNGSYNFDFIFENIEKYIKEYDIKIINDEVLISGDKYNISGFPRFIHL